jgi:hypothetical protein
MFPRYFRRIGSFFVMGGLLAGAGVKSGFAACARRSAGNAVEAGTPRR